MEYYLNDDENKLTRFLSKTNSKQKVVLSLTYNTIPNSHFVIKKLYLTGIQLCKINACFFDKYELSKVKFLFVPHNINLKTIDFNYFYNLTSIEINHHEHDFDPNLIQKCNKLKSIKFMGEKFEHSLVFLHYFTQLERLTFIVSKFNQVLEPIFELTKLKSLSIISASFNQRINFRNQKTKLKKLKIIATRFNNKIICLSHLTELKKLKIKSFKFNHLLSLSKLSKLKKISLRLSKFNQQIFVNLPSKLKYIHFESDLFNHDLCLSNLKCLRVFTFLSNAMNGKINFLNLPLREFRFHCKKFNNTLKLDNVLSKIKIFYFESNKFNCDDLILTEMKIVEILYVKCPSFNKRINNQNTIDFTDFIYLDKLCFKIKSLTIEFNKNVENYHIIM